MPEHDPESPLGRIVALQARIEETKAELNQLYLRRADLFLETIEAAPDTPVKAMADVAGVTGPAVSQQIEKARVRRDVKLAEQVVDAEPEPEPEPETAAP